MHSVILAMPYVYVTNPFVGQMCWKIKLIKLSYALQFSFIGYGHVRSVIKAMIDTLSLAYKTYLTGHKFWLC